MKLKHILEQYGKLSDDNICDSLTNLGNSLFKNNWNFVNSVMSRTYPIISNK